METMLVSANKKTRYIRIKYFFIRNIFSPIFIYLFFFPLFLFSIFRFAYFFRSSSIEKRIIGKLPRNKWDLFFTMRVSRIDCQSFLNASVLKHVLLKYFKYSFKKKKKKERDRMKKEKLKVK